MKISNFLALLRNDASWIAAVFLYGLYYFVQSALRDSGDHMFSLSYGGADTFLLLVPFMSINPLFPNGCYRLKSSSSSPLGTLEFLFTRAISRSALFSVRTGIYLALTLLPMGTVWIYSYSKPTVRIELPYSPANARTVTSQFYLDHFRGAYVQKDNQDPEGNKYYVVLPEGRVTVAAFTLFWALIVTLFWQVVVIAWQPTRTWVLVLVLLTCLLTPIVLGLPAARTPSLYEAGLGWLAQHSTAAFLGLGIFTLVAQLYCCRRFVNTEITS